jgi:predicted acetyltransferase
MVGVLPSHRRRGILTQMMRRQMDDIRERNEPIAVLWASEGNIYGRFGYGMATVVQSFDIERDRAVFLDNSPPTGRTRLVTVDEALKILPDVYERKRVHTPGMFARSPKWWKWHTLFDPSWEREGGGPMFRVVWENEDGAGAYALYRITQKWGDDGVPAGHVQVLEAIPTSYESTKELWRFLFGVDLVARVKAWFEPVDTPLMWMLSEPRRLRAMAHDGIWLRVVDVPSALEARSYAAEGSVVFNVKDDFCAWNSGRWRLDGAGGGGSVTSTTDDGDVSLDVQALGSVYLGAVTFASLARANQAHGSPDAIARADALFRTDAAPWCPEVF